ncbi:pancreatic lipase-related protein 2 [Antrostomus carolinensis]|uniref:pancreatic lipase-related protein 2 n=1 Tax=Antrostomus carolinensis TaxID=279965 RepID=UPI0010A9848C|nr:pancreatic lipase-related protein 2 [Antrostomus carolinensis]
MVRVKRQKANSSTQNDPEETLAAATRLKAFQFQEIPVVGMWIIAFYLLGTVAGKEVCYRRLGCFTDDPPWSGIPGRLLPGLPDSPEHMNISFFLYTRETGNNSQVISAINSSTIQNSHFSSQRKTSFIIHGFSSTGKKGWVVEMCLLLLEVENINCIAVDWEDGAKGTYVSAVNNIRVVGAEIAYFIKILQKIYRYSPCKVHLIGHSLGAHTAGEAGRRIRCIRRITGLDPAGPYFEGTPPKVRLDPSDANFVDVIHSNAANFPAVGLGMYNTTGHLDFYPNGGTVMPGCNDLVPEIKQRHFEVIVADATIVGGCHHSRSHEYYFKSILYPTGYLGYPCETYKSFESGDCFPCPQEGCPMMGHYADRFPAKLKRVNQKYYLNTAADPPFATWRQKVFMKLSGVKKMRGDINLIFHDTQGNTKEYEIASGVLSQDEVYIKYLDVEINPRKTKKIEFLWNKAAFNLLWARLGAEIVNIIHGDDGRRSAFCGRGTVTYGVPQLLTPC